MNFHKETISIIATVSAIVIGIQSLIKELPPHRCKKCNKKENQCKRCSNRDTQLKRCHEYAKSKGGRCLDYEYFNAHTRMDWQCEYGHREWKAVSYSILNLDTWCPECGILSRSHILKDCQVFAESKGGKCLSIVYTNALTHMDWQCEFGHKIWTATFNNVKDNDTWCPECERLSRSSTLKECQVFAESKGGICLSIVYTNCMTDMKWQCEFKHPIWITTFNHVKNDGTWCPYCLYKNEQECRDIMERLLEREFPKSYPRFLKTKKYPRGLELDGFNEESKIAFEYNGIQHYEYTSHFHRNGIQDFEDQKERDKTKLELCMKNGIILVIIPFYIENKESYIKNYIYP